VNCVVPVSADNPPAYNLVLVSLQLSSKILVMSQAVEILQILIKSSSGLLGES